MSINPEFSVNAVNNTASLNLFTGENLIAFYEFDNSNVTLSNRPTNTIIPQQIFDENVALIEKWIRLIKTDLVIVWTKNENFETEINIDNSVLSGKFESTDILSQLSYDFENKEFIFFARPQQTISFALYVRWAKFLRQISEDAVQL